MVQLKVGKLPVLGASGEAYEPVPADVCEPRPGAACGAGGQVCDVLALIAAKAVRGPLRQQAQRLLRDR